MGLFYLKTPRGELFYHSHNKRAGARIREWREWRGWPGATVNCSTLRL